MQLQMHRAFPKCKRGSGVKHRQILSAQDLGQARSPFHPVMDAANLRESDYPLRTDLE